MKMLFLKNKKYQMLSGLLLSSVLVQAKTGSLTSIVQNEILLLIACGLLIFVILVIINLLLNVSSFLEHADMKFGKANVFSGFIKSMTNAVPIEEEETVMMDHVYDGIRELDNNLPTWWKYLFYATIVFSFVYIYIYHYSDFGHLQIQEYEQEMLAAEKKLAANVDLAVVSVDENSVAMSDEKGIANGLALYTNFCAACHGKVGEGNMVGPNLTDEYWLHGGSLSDIFKTIKYGVPQKGMISWKSQLSGSDIQDITSYIFTLKGTNPPNAKAPQGEKFEAVEAE